MRGSFVSLAHNSLSMFSLDYSQNAVYKPVLKPYDIRMVSCLRYNAAAFHINLGSIPFRKIDDWHKICGIAAGYYWGIIFCLVCKAVPRKNIKVAQGDAHLVFCKGNSLCKRVIKIRSYIYLNLVF